MVVEIEGVQRIIRRIRKESAEAVRVHQKRDVHDFRISINNVLDDCIRVVSLILAETGHWQPRFFSQAVEAAAQEQAIAYSDVGKIQYLPIQAAQLQKAADVDEVDTDLLASFLANAELLCKNLTDYIVHTELPI